MEIIAQIIAAKNGDKGFILTNENGDGWCAAIGNPSQNVPSARASPTGTAGRSSSPTTPLPRHRLTLCSRRFLPDEYAADHYWVGMKEVYA